MGSALLTAIAQAELCAPLPYSASLFPAVCLHVRQPPPGTPPKKFPVYELLSGPAYPGQRQLTSSAQKVREASIGEAA